MQRQQYSVLIVDDNRSNLRILYIIVGVLAMLGSSFYIHSIKSGAAAPVEVSG